MNGFTRRKLAFALCIIFVFTSFIASSTLSRSNEFNFEDYQDRMLSEDILLEKAMNEVNSAVTIVKITEQVTAFVPMGEWFHTIGAIPTEGDPDQPFFVLALKGEFTRDGKSGNTFTVAIDALEDGIRSGSRSGGFIDPRNISDMNITGFPPPITLPPITVVNPETTRDILPIPGTPDPIGSFRSP